MRSVSARRVESLVEALGIASRSKSQIFELAVGLDEMVTGLRNRPLNQGPYTNVWADALTMKVREGGRVPSPARSPWGSTAGNTVRFLASVSEAQRTGQLPRLLPLPGRSRPQRDTDGDVRRPDRPERRFSQRHCGNRRGKGAGGTTYSFRGGAPWRVTHLLLHLCG